MSKRRRAPPSPLELAHRKSDDEFVNDYLIAGPSPTPWTTTWTHPLTSALYTLTLTSRPSPSTLDTCLSLISLTSLTHYTLSATKWNPTKKRKEMQSPELRYILVTSSLDSTIAGFTSLMPTYEEGQPVIYCYEIHLLPELQGTGLGSLLMSFHERVATNMPPVTKVMLTCFLRNEKGLEFYRRRGFVVDEISPVERRLRGGKVFRPDYAILSKRVREDEDGEGATS